MESGCSRGSGTLGQVFGIELSELPFPGPFHPTATLPLQNMPGNSGLVPFASTKMLRRTAPESRGAGGRWPHSTVLPQQLHGRHYMALWLSPARTENSTGLINDLPNNKLTHEMND